jgi:hypothetical protein
LALYLFLVTVADGAGLSYYSDESVCRLLGLDIPALARVRRELVAAGLIAYEKPLYQVLALDCPPTGGPGPVRQTDAGTSPPPARSFTSAGRGQPLTIGQIMRAMEKLP